MKETEDDLIARIPAAKANYATGKLEDFTAFFAYIRHHSRDFSVLLQYGRANFIDRLMRTVMEHFPEMLSENKNPFQIHLGYVFAISGVVGIMSEWIQNDFPMSDQEFAEYALKMCLRANDFPAE